MTTIFSNAHTSPYSITHLQENTGNNVVNLADKLEHGVFRKVLEGELPLSSVAGIGLTKDSMAIARNDLATFEGRPDVLLHGVVGRVLAELGLHLAQPEEDLLVGEAVERAGETVQGSTEGEEGVGEGRADELAGVGGDIATLVVTK